MNSSNEHEKILLTAFESVLSPHTALYAAGPLDHGKLYYYALAKMQGGNSDVRETNQRNLTAFVSDLRARRSEPVIDPGLLHVGHWDARTIGQFFLEVIKRFVKEAGSIDGWEFSHGASKEFIYCFQLSIPCFDQRGLLMTLNHGAELTYAAVTELDRLQIPSEKLAERLRLFEEKKTK